jgi:riboflavin synthase
MKLTFIGYKDTPVDIFPEIEKRLKKNISGVEIETRFVPFVEDLPEIARESAQDSNFIFVFALLPDKSNIFFIEEKLIDVEIETKTRILKVIMEDDLSNVEEDFLEEKDKLIEDFTQTIIDILFNEKKFAPKDRDFGL